MIHSSGSGGRWQVSADTQAGDRVTKDEMGIWHMCRAIIVSRLEQYQRKYPPMGHSRSVPYRQVAPTLVSCRCMQASAGSLNGTGPYRNPKTLPYACP
jgi:hypothetical protein